MNDNILETIDNEMNNSYRCEDFIIPEIEEDENEEKEDQEEEEENEIDLESLIAKIDARIAELEEEQKTNDEIEKKILKEIENSLSKHHLQYVYSSDKPKTMEILVKPFSMQVFLLHEKVNLRVTFPFRVQRNSLALVALYIVQFNKENDNFAVMNLDMIHGKVTMEYSYLAGKVENFDATIFWEYLMSAIVPSLEEFAHLQRLVVGKLSEEETKKYRNILFKSLSAICNE